MTRDLHLQELVIEQPKERTVTQDIRGLMDEIVSAAKQMGVEILMDRASMQIVSLKADDPASVKRVQKMLADALEELTAPDVDVEESLGAAMMIVQASERIKELTTKSGKNKLN